jgi:hypothetical protein
MGGDGGNRSETRTTQWAHALGEERHARDRRTAQATTSREEDAARMSAASAERWTAIVAGIRRLVDAYNTGAGQTVLSVEEETDELSVTIAAGADAPSLTAALEDTVICVQVRAVDSVSCSPKLDCVPIAATMRRQRTSYRIGCSDSDVDVFSLGQCARRALPRLDAWSFFRRWRLGATSAARGARRHTPSSRSNGLTRSVLSVPCAGMCGTHVGHRVRRSPR